MGGWEEDLATLNKSAGHKRTFRDHALWDRTTCDLFHFRKNTTTSEYDPVILIHFNGLLSLMNVVFKYITINIIFIYNAPIFFKKNVLTFTRIYKQSN